MVTKIIIAFIGFIYAVVAQAAYEPAVTFEKYIKTITVHKDGTSEDITESLNKIETQKGIDALSQVDFTYIKSMNSIEILEGYTITPNGKKINIKKSDIRERDDSIDRGADMFSDTKHKIIVFPEVGIGSMLYHKTKQKQFKTKFKNQFTFGEITFPYFKYNYEEINFIVDKGITLNFASKGFEGGLVKETKTQRFYTYTFKQDTASSKESDSVSIYDTSDYLIASSFNNYIELGEAYQKLSQAKTKPTAFIQGLADAIIAKSSCGDKRAEAKALYEWIVKNIRYVAVYADNGGFEPHYADDIAEKGYGDCKDHAVLYEALLAARNIKSSPAIINSGNAYQLPKYPIISPLNHVITYIPEFDLYADTTTQSVPFGIIPFYVRGKPTVLAALDKTGETPAMKANENIVTTKVTLKIQPNGIINGISRTEIVGPIESSYRESQEGNVGRNDEDIVNGILSQYGETGSGQYQFTAPDDFSKPYEENGTFTLDPVSNFPGPAAMTIPVGLTQGRIYTITKDKPLNNRKYPYVCFGRTYIDNYDVEFPQNTKITRIPTDISYSENGMTYKATYKRNNNVVNVTREMILDNKNMYCEPNREAQKQVFFEVLQKDLRSQIFYE